MSVYGWGSNRFGELGTTTEGTSTKHEPTLLDNFDGHLAAECASGVAYACSGLCHILLYSL